MQTRTYAEILARQGEFAQAIEIYRKLIARSPDDASLARRLHEIEALAAGDFDALALKPKAPALARLEALLHRIQSRRRR